MVRSGCVQASVCVWVGGLEGGGTQQSGGFCVMHTSMTHCVPSTAYSGVFSGVGAYCNPCLKPAKFSVVLTFNSFFCQSAPLTLSSASAKADARNVDA